MWLVHRVSRIQLFGGVTMGGGGGGRWSSDDFKSLFEEAKKELRKAAAKRNVFLSFPYEDLAEVNLLRAHAKNPNSDIEFNDWSVQEAFESSRADYIKQKIGERISQCSVVVVYLSSNTAQSRWVEWEVEESIARGKHVICVHPDVRAPHGSVPGFVSRYGLKVVPWSELSSAIKAAP